MSNPGGHLWGGDMVQVKGRKGISHKEWEQVTVKR
jgi:hypothetical protein